MAIPAAGSGSVGFPHSANFTLTFFYSIHPLRPLGGAGIFFFFFCSSPFSSLPAITLYTPPHIFDMCCLYVCVCADRLAGVCRCSPYHSTSHKPAPPNTHRHSSLSSHSKTVMSVLMNSFRVNTIPVETLINTHKQVHSRYFFKQSFYLHVAEKGTIFQFHFNKLVHKNRRTKFMSK